MTLNSALDRFHENPTVKTAMKLAKTVRDGDEMISHETSAAIAAELEQAGFKMAMLELMK